MENMLNLAKGKTFEVKNPATQEVIANVHEATKEDIDRACRTAREAFENGPWRTMPLSERCKELDEWHKLSWNVKKKLLD